MKVGSHVVAAAEAEAPGEGTLAWLGAPPRDGRSAPQDRRDKFGADPVKTHDWLPWDRSVTLHDRPGQAKPAGEVCEVRRGLPERERSVDDT